jgi:hypothetical protein
MGQHRPGIISPAQEQPARNRSWSDQIDNIDLSSRRKL